ncbi:hypothetical protein MP478_08760 [Chryseobacterium sp. WG14]|uniref:hypothetical protein n=1 Tax=unclassified Chryseobacterium TaxID=2593645 RepID=UPI001E15143B|nr:MULTISPECIES: hypothetical protein [unclassified Chryseobacterium]MCQ9637294.1 hypothetical protein [Chryseobacterium sp. WG23]MCQ9639480.1 hypothetical protein [Chryseobacterium sp. WG14]CAH0208050.1 hypothetical protein SRABI04_02154 [Chryseobacterium sp. Bi04]
MENNTSKEDFSKQKDNSKWKQWIKRFGVGGIIFFTVKGIITSTLIYFLGKNFWNIITKYFSTIFG